jgi:C4-dicarboxylate-specific signal transduction histidine kinase
MQMSLQEKLKKMEEKIRALELDKISLIKELQHINAELDHKVESRTEELKISNRKLINVIAERKQAERALKESHETFLTVLDSIDATIYVADMDTYEIIFMEGIPW